MAILTNAGEAQAILERLEEVNPNSPTLGKLRSDIES